MKIKKYIFVKGNETKIIISTCLDDAIDDLGSVVDNSFEWSFTKNGFSFPIGLYLEMY